MLRKQPQRNGPSNCLAKTQVYAKPKGEVYGLSLIHISLENEDAFYQFENYSLKKQRGYYIYYETNQEMKKEITARSWW